MSAAVAYFIGFLSGIIGMVIFAFFFARRQPRKISEGLMKFELEEEQRMYERMKKKIKKEFINEK